MPNHNIKLITVYVVLTVLEYCGGYSVPPDASSEINSFNDLHSESDESNCEITVRDEGANMFRSQLLKRDPHFVQFKIRQIGNKRYNVSENVFEPFRWSWTYNGSAGPYPFISLSLDYGLLSFHLLETKTLYFRHEIGLIVSESCNLKYGSYLTTLKIARAFIKLINDSSGSLPTYAENYFCQYQINPLIFKPPINILGQYFISTVNPIIYNCSYVAFNYTSKRFDVRPSYIGHIPDDKKWTEAATLAHLVAIMALLFWSPIIVFGVGGWMAKYEKIIPNEEYEEYEVIGEPIEVVSCEVDNNDDWIYADGITHPLNVSDALSLQRLGLLANYPIFVGRLRRLIFVLLVPFLIIMQIVIYHQGAGMWDDGDKITVNMAVNRNIPMGFLSILGDPDRRRKVFVYFLGGPVGIICLYYALSFLFIVLPRSLKQIVEDGLPRERSCIRSPLFLTFSQTLNYSKVSNRYQTIASGYSKAIFVIKCRFYMLFALPFWKFTFTTQINRWSSFCQDPSRYTGIIRCVLFPVYLVMCFLEVCFSVLYYGVPFCSFITIVAYGATRSLGYLAHQNRILRAVLSFRITLMIVFIVFIVYTYIISLLFLHSLMFITRMMSFCFIAVILYPHVSFGYLFFFTVIFYYLINLIQGFSDGYMELLATAVDLSRQMNEYDECIYNVDGHVAVFSQKIKRVKDIKINDQLLNVPPDILKSIRSRDVEKVKEKNGCFGIPKSLFTNLVQEFRPVHRELLSLTFKAGVIVLFVTALLNISSTTGPTNEISEVMHVIFIVVIGALPRLASSLLSHRNESQLKEIRERQLREVILKYWMEVDREMREEYVNQSHPC